MTSPIKYFNRPTVRLVSDEAEEALQAVADKYGFALKRENGRFSEENLTVKFSFAVPAADGAPADFATKAVRVGLDADCWGKQFVSRFDVYEVTGINLRAPKYPVNAKRVSDGRRFKFPVSAVTALTKAA